MEREARWVDYRTSRIYREVVADWLTIEVFDGAFPATQWRRAPTRTTWSRQL
jgi:hypothetical protein